MSNIFDKNKVFETAAELKAYINSPTFTAAAGKAPATAIRYALEKALLSLPEGEARVAALKDILESGWFPTAAGKDPGAAIGYTLHDALSSLPEVARAAALKDILDSDWFTAAAAKESRIAIQYTLQYGLKSLPEGAARAAALSGILDSDWFIDAAGKAPYAAIAYTLEYALSYLPEGERAAALSGILNSGWFIAAAGKVPATAIVYTLRYALSSLPEGERTAALKDILNSDWFIDAAGKEPVDAMLYTLEYTLKSLPEGEARIAALKDILDSDWFTDAAGKEPRAAIKYTLDFALKSLPEGERAAALKDVLSRPVFIAAIKADPREFLVYGQKLLDKATPKYKAGIERELTRARNLHLRSAYNPRTWGDRISFNINHLTINIFPGWGKNKTIAAAPDKPSTAAPPPLEGFTLDNLTLHVAFNKEAQENVVHVVNLRKIIDETKTAIENTPHGSLDRAVALGSLSEIMNYVGRTSFDVQWDKTLSSKEREQQLAILDYALAQIQNVMQDSGGHTGNDLPRHIIDDAIVTQGAGVDKKPEIISDISTRLKKYGFPDYKYYDPSMN